MHFRFFLLYKGSLGSRAWQNLFYFYFLHFLPLIKKTKKQTKNQTHQTIACEIEFRTKNYIENYFFRLKIERVVGQQMPCAMQKAGSNK